MTTQLTASPIPPTGLDPLEPGFQRDPYPYYHWMLRNDPVHCGNSGTWYITRYADVHMVMSDERFGCASVRDFWEEMIGPRGAQGYYARHAVLRGRSPTWDAALADQAGLLPQVLFGVSTRRWVASTFDNEYPRDTHCLKVLTEALFGGPPDKLHIDVAKR